MGLLIHMSRYVPLYNKLSQPDFRLYLVGGGGAGQRHLLLITTNSHRWTVFADSHHLKYPPAPTSPAPQYINCEDTLVAIGGGYPLTDSLHIYCPHSRKWERMDSNFPEAVRSTCSITLPKGEMIVSGGWGNRRLSPRVYKGSVK